MKVIGWEDVYNCNYTLNEINSFRQHWDITNTFSCIGRPKIMQMFLYLDGLDADYTLKNGEKIYAKDGALIYIPIGIEYVVRFYGKRKTTPNSVAIRFFINDMDGIQFNLSDRIEVFNSVECSQLIKKINNAGEAVPVCYGELKAGMYELVSLLSKHKKNKKFDKFSVIEKGISYIDCNFEKDFNIKDIADMCNVSEIYFRKLFKKYSGYSPVEYKARKKIERAKSYLIYGNLNVSEIAQYLGYTDTSYFCKQFKMYTGTTPMDYKNNFENQ